MVKILSQGGRSLADMYDVEGSIAGIDHLETHELPIVHEMGAVLFSERFRTTIRHITTGDIAQNITFNTELNTLPVAITRILGVQVVATDGTRVSNCQLSVFNPVTDTDFPLWVLDGQNVQTMRLRVLGTTGTFSLLVPEPSLALPSFATGGTLQGTEPVSQLRLRGVTTGFGAGTVEIIAVVYLGFTFTGGVSAFGAHVPSW